MRSLYNELEETNNPEVLDAIQTYVRAQLHPAKWTFVLPQTSVPACLATKALWAAFISWSFGPETAVSNGAHAICGTIAGLLFGSNSLYGAVSGTNKLLKEVDTNVTSILTAMSKLSVGDKKKVTEQIKNIPTKPQSLSWSQMVNVAFAWYTATITVFTYLGGVRDAVTSDPCIPNRPCAGTYPAFPIAATFAVFWGACALSFAYCGQREQAFLTQVNNKLKDLVAKNPGLNQAINAHSSVVAVGEGGMFNSPRSPINENNDREAEITPLLLPAAQHRSS